MESETVFGLNFVCMKIFTLDEDSLSNTEKGKRNSSTVLQYSEDDSSLSIRLLFTAILSVLSGGFHFGFQMAIINPMAEQLQIFLIESFKITYGIELSESMLAWTWSFVAGVLFIGATLGATIVTRIINRKGPSKALLCSAMILLLSTPLIGLSYSFHSSELFVISRLLSGIGIGMGTTSHAVFLTEISPAKFRGIIGTFGGFSTNIGYIFASAIGLPIVFGTSQLWPIAYYLEAIPCLISLIFNILFFHESPVFLMRNKREKEARSSLSAYSNNLDVQSEISRLRIELKNVSETDNLRDIWDHGPSRRALVLSVSLNISAAFSGITAVSFFGTFLLQSIGFTEMEASLLNCLSAFAGTAGAIVATWGVDKIGRRLLVIGSLLSLALINILMMMLVMLFNNTHNVTIGYGFLFLFILFLFTFSAGVGPTAWFLGSELSPSTSRARIQSLSVSAQNICCFISPIIYYPIQSIFGPIAFIIFIIPLCTSAIYFYRSLPETKGHTFEQITQSLSEKNFIS